MRKVLNWLLSKLPIIKQLNGYKTELGFALFVLGWLLQGVDAAISYFPGISILPILAENIGRFAGALSSLFTSLGIPIMVIGVGHKAIKENLDED